MENNNSVPDIPLPVIKHIAPSAPSPELTPAVDPFGFKRAHLVGIGGCGMSAIAWALLACGIEVSGSDAKLSETCRRLVAAGARVSYNHTADNLGEAEVVILSTAIRESNPEWIAARERGLRILHRSEALALFLQTRQSVLIAGTHGKTTTSALMGLALEAAEFDPWVFVGGSVPEFEGNTRVGGVEFAVAEADESDGSFERLPANHLIVTNIEPDHLDYWQTEEAMVAGYLRVIKNVSRGGVVLACLDDRGVRHVLKHTTRPCLTYSTQAEVGHYSAGNIKHNGTSSEFDFYIGRKLYGRFEIGVPGLHNVSNAVAVLAMTNELDGNLESVRSRLKNFHGVGRRFEIKGRHYGVTVIDDYAHHPTEISATIQAAQSLRELQGGRLIVVFQPHRYTRTRDLLEEFVTAFDGADLLILTEIYSAGEDPINGINSNILFHRICTEASVPIRLIPQRRDIARDLAGELHPGDLVLTLGAGDIFCTAEDLLRVLQNDTTETGV